MSKRGTKSGTLRLVTDPEEDIRAKRSARLRALREALKLTQQQVADLSADAAKRLGGGDYKPIDRTAVIHDEAGRGQFQKDATRAVYCEIYRITRDQFAHYLDGNVGLDDLLAQRAESAGAAPVSSRGRTITYGDAPNWAGLLADARQLAAFQGVELADETLAELRDIPFISGPATTIDAPLIAQQAIALQAWRRRSGGK